MPNVGVGEVQAWLETTKANLGSSLDTELEASIAAQVLSRVSLSYDVSTWTTPETTPKLVRKVIAMKYAAWFYQRQYSEDNDEPNNYALLLNAQAEQLLDGIVSGANDLPEVDGIGIEYSAGRGSYEDTTPVFTMGRVF
jgi:CRISPR/Cas system CMR-associated protein Cmr1 (group 7 of RAMP superfamily)